MFTPSPYQQAIFDFVKNGKGHGIVQAVAGSGKCLGYNTPILLFNGTIKMVQDLTPKDVLIGPDSNQRKILSVNKGFGKLYKITPVKGEPFICNEDHILTLSGSNRFNGQIIDISLKDILYSNLPNFRGDRIDHEWKLVRAKIEVTNPPILNFDPYIMGVWLGDGFTDSTSIVSQDSEIIEACQHVADKYKLQLKVTDENDKGLKKLRFSIGTRFDSVRSIPHLMRRELKLFVNQNKQKTIPHNYLWNTHENRLQLLAGILDSDGHYSRGFFEVTTKLKHLAEQYAFLARSLGLAAYIKEKHLVFRSKEFTVWRVSISGELSIIPCRVKRKQPKQRKQIKRTDVTGWSVEYIREGSYYGFTLTGDGRFLLGDFTVTHNTTTNIQALDYVDPLIDVVFLAFNKHIADELKSRGVQCASTFHSLGKANITSAYPHSKFNQYKLYDLLDRVENTLLDEVRNSIIKLIALLKANLLEATPDNINGLADTFDIDIEDNEVTIYRCTRELLEASLNDITQYDFDDMIYWPAIGKVGCKKFDFIFCDEFQDVCKSQIEFVIRSLADDGRLLLIGDPNQGIYAFRGAFTGIMDYAREKLNATVLPLSISYRAPKVIVNLVNSVFPHICFEGSQAAKEGYISNLQYDDLTMVTDDGDAVICRTNAPLVKPAFQLLKEGRKAVILGRDIGQGLITLVNKRAKLISVKNADNQLAELLFQLQVYFDNEKVKLERMKRLGKLATLQDQIETIVAIADGCETIAQLKAKIESIFSNNRSGVVFSSIHKAKGLEWENVFILRPEQMPHPMAKDPVQKAQEMNIKYVAFTRSKCNLYLVQGGK